MDLASAANFIFGVLSILAQIISLLLIFAWLFGFPIHEVIRKNGLLLAFAAVVLATLGSLTYSELIGYEPCKLCWVQRIFMYPQVLILGFALFGKHRGNKALLDASLALSVIGAFVALYHYLMQLGIVPEGSCAAIGYSVSCAKVFVLQFGYLTLPLMAFSGFVLVALILFLKRKE